jgi:hypothetical protein
MEDKMLIDKIVADWNDKELEYKVERLNPWSYYFVKLKFNKNNGDHNAVMHTQGYKPDWNKDLWVLSNTVTLFAVGYEDDIIKIDLNKIYWFRVEKEIQVMDCTGCEIVLEKDFKNNQD